MAHNSRKRTRSCEEECCELMPISKRINDLHIRSGFPESNTPFNNHSDMIPTPQNPREMVVANNNMYIAEMQRQNIGNKDLRSVYTYSPELNAVDNPYYYHVNGVLYEAHIQRMQRLSKPNA